MRHAARALARRAKIRLAPGTGQRFPDAGTQLGLSITYRTTALEPRPLSDYGFKCYSQTDEDGIPLYLFSRLGTTNRRCVEICAGDGIECNTANLIINHRWHGLLIDGEKELVVRGRRFYATHPATYVYPPKLSHAHVTRDNVDHLIARDGFAGEVDLLSLDLDGVDYWIWKGITVLQPRVVVLEYQDILGAHRSWTVPYSDAFDSGKHSMTGDMPNFAGASLLAFTKLAAEKGYRLVGANRLGYNAFFVRNDVGADLIPEVSVEDCFLHPKVAEGIMTRFPQVADLPWVEV